MKFKLNGSRITLAVYIVFLIVSYVLFRNGLAPDIMLDVAGSWQMLLLVIGIMQVFSRQRVMGIIFIFLGLFTMLPMFTGHLPFLDSLLSQRRFWIIVPVFIGCVILVSEIVSYRRRSKAPCQEESTDSFGKVYGRIRFESSSVAVSGDIFTGGDISVFAATAEVDLRRCQIASSLAEMNLKVTLGSLRLIVPNEWKVEIFSSSFAAGVKDIRDKGNADSDDAQTLLLNCDVSFANIEISNE